MTQREEKLARALAVALNMTGARIESVDVAEGDDLAVAYTIKGTLTREQAFRYRAICAEEGGRGLADDEGV